MAAYRSANATVSAHTAVPVTPNNSTIIPCTRGLYVGTTGDLSVILPESTSVVTFVGIPSGSFVPLQVVTVLATGTTASDIIALY